VHAEPIPTQESTHPLSFNGIISQAAKRYIEFFESKADIFYGTSFPFTICLCNIDQVPNRHNIACGITAGKF
jgi:hypothetical protein